MNQNLKKLTKAVAIVGLSTVTALVPAQDTKRIVEWEELPAKVKTIPTNLNIMKDGLMMKHQSEAIALSHQYDICVFEKGRRTGLTFALSLDKSLVAASQRSDGGDNVYYIGDTKDKGLGFIGYCAKFLRTIAKAQSQGVSSIEEFLFQDQNIHGDTKEITSWRIRLSSGFEIVALSSRPENLRSLQGHVIIDEAAFHNNVQEVLDSACALLIWGSKIVIISTHNGVGNAFNQLIKEIQQGVYEDTAIVYKATFDDAVANGLYERVCLIKGEVPTDEGKKKWYRKIRNSYGSRKAQMRQELDAIPKAGNGTSLPNIWIEQASVQGRQVLRLELDDSFLEKTTVEREDFAEGWIEANLKPLLAELDPKWLWYFGQDYARHRDFSIITPLGIMPNLIRDIPFVIEMHKVPARQQMQILWAMIEGMPKFIAGAMDATGTGETIAELTADEFGYDRIIQVKLTQKWYGTWMPKMVSLFEDGTINMPADSNLTQDLRAIEEVNGIPMVEKLKRKDLKNPELERHGDFSPSLCLANASYMQISMGAYVIGSRPRKQDDGVSTGVRSIAGRFRNIIRGY